MKSKARKRCSSGKWFHQWDASSGRRVCVLCGIVNYEDWTTAERFWHHVDKGDGSGCWNWIGAYGTRGYGVFWTNEPKRTHTAATKVAWYLTTGEWVPPYPKGTLCHKCDNPKCVRPDHLFAGTQLDNIRDMVRKGRKTGAKLSPDTVGVIKTRRKAGERVKDLAKEYGVGRTTIGRIVNGRGWYALETAGVRP